MGGGGAVGTLQNFIRSRLFPKFLFLTLIIRFTYNAHSDKLKKRALLDNNTALKLSYHLPIVCVES